MGVCLSYHPLRAAIQEMECWAPVVLLCHLAHFLVGVSEVPSY